MSEDKIRRLDGIVMSCTVRNGKSPGGNATTMRVKSEATGKVYLLRAYMMDPPLPGTVISARGVAKDFGDTVIIQALKDSVIATSGQQAVLLRDYVVDKMRNLRIPIDIDLIDSVFLDRDMHLCSLDEEKFFDVLENKLKIDALTEAFKKNDFSKELCRIMFEGLMSIRVPFDPNSNFEIPKLLTNTWPADVMKLSVSSSGDRFDYQRRVEGREPHPAFYSSERLKIQELLSSDGIDNFFRAMSIAVAPEIYRFWMGDNNRGRRNALITEAYINEKQMEGFQMFTGETLKRLDNLYGIPNPEQVAARLSSMFKVNIEGLDTCLIPQGTYQSSSRIGLLSNFPSGKIPLGYSSDKPEGIPVNLDTKGLDPYQVSALQSFANGPSVMLLAGPPGTGKSHVVSRLITTARDAHERVLIITPTGKASARLNLSFVQDFPDEKVRPRSQTMHAMFFSKDFQSGGRNTLIIRNGIDDALSSKANHIFPTNVDRAFRFTQMTDRSSGDRVPKSDNRIYAEASPPPVLSGCTVFVDESSMLTNDHIALIMAMNPKRIVLIGDPSQLFPVGSGKPFRDLIDLARAGYLEDKMSLAELKTDHRATKDLAACTAVVRGTYDDKGNLIEGGKLPENRVTRLESNDPTLAAEQAFRSEFSVIESPTAEDTIDFVGRVYNNILKDTKPFYRFHYETMGAHDPDSANMVLPFAMAQDMSCQRATVPNVITMAFTNDEVKATARHIKGILRSHNESGNRVSEFGPLLDLVSKGMHPGDMIMQTKNDNMSNRNPLEYTTPQGKRATSGSMNGETYLWMGSNIWMPLPIPGVHTDIATYLNNLWKNVGLYDQVVSDMAAGRHTEPNYHADLYSQLDNVKKSKVKDADKLRNCSLGEVFAIDVLRLQGMGAKRGDITHVPADMIKTFTVFPKLPREMNVKGDDGILGLATEVFKVTIPKYLWSEKVDVSQKTVYNNEIHGNSKENLNNFSFGEDYTVHKAQGSQGRISITLVPKPLNADTAYTHEMGTYTAITRAQENAIVMLTGMTVQENNQLWANMREAMSKIPSANVAIATGQMPPLAESLQMITATLPDSRRRISGPYCSPEAVAREYRQRTLATSMGLPADVRGTNAQSTQRDRMMFSTPNAIGIEAHTSNGITYLDHGTVALRNINADLACTKDRRMSWQPEMTTNMALPPGSFEEVKKEAEDLEVAAFAKANQEIANDIANNGFGDIDLDF